MQFSGQEVLEFLLTFSESILAGFVVNVIYNKLCNGANRIEINGNRVKLQENSIAKTIETLTDNSAIKPTKIETDDSSNKGEKPS